MHRPVQTIIMSERIEVNKSELPDDAFKKVSFSEGGMGPLIKEADMTHIIGSLQREQWSCWLATCHARKVAASLSDP